MKKMFLGLVFVLFAVQVHAASLLTPSVIVDSSTSGTAYAFGNSLNSGAFAENATVADTWGLQSSTLTSVLTVSSFNPVALYRVRVENDANVEIATADFSGGGLNSLSFTFTDTNVVYRIFVNSINSTGALAALTGSGTTTYDLKVSAVPIPAAVWLFGSALMGLVGVSRRKSATLAV